MPRRDDIHKILIIGSGPIIISQACEFDYSGAQACKALREEGFEVILVNSNPATIMTDPGMADMTYIEPITPAVVTRIIDRERPDALLPTLGGQTALNTAVALWEQGVLEKYGVKMIGADYDAIHRAEDRDSFKKAMEQIGLDLPRSGLAHTLEQARAAAAEIGFPIIIRPAFTLGGTGGGVAYNQQEFDRIAAQGLEASLITEILVEESIIGWKEFELEVMRDHKDNVVIICSIENLDPMGVHTGDSITVAPAQTLTDKEYQLMRDAAVKIIRKIGVETGGSNVQFAVDPATGRMVVIEMNPRVSRSSALASKATGFPIAKIAAKLAVGYTLDEISNDITRETPACFEPTIDYCVVKIPRFTFEKFPEADPTLGVSMKSVGETMAIGRTFKEALGKGLRSLEIGRAGFGMDGKDPWPPGSLEAGLDDPGFRRLVKDKLSTPNPERIFYIRAAMLAGMDDRRIFELSAVDPWFLDNMRQIVETEQALERFRAQGGGVGDLEADDWRRVKSMGFSDRQIAWLFGVDELEVRSRRKALGVEAAVKLVDTCAAEFEAFTPYYYSTYEQQDEVRASERPGKVVILGGGPNRIGQGIEFDYCCVHAALALKEIGYETIMVNSNPETVSTDYDTSDKLYFEPLTLEDVLNICDKERPTGVIVQFGGQTPLNLSRRLEAAGVPIVGTSPEAIDRAEDREKFQVLLEKLGLLQPPNGTALSLEQALAAAERIGYPVLLRPSYVLGGRAMRVVYDPDELGQYMHFAMSAADIPDNSPVLIDKFLEDAVEVDVDVIADGTRVVIGGVMEHIEQAGVHSGDSACCLPPFSLPGDVVDRIKRDSEALALELGVRGLMNVQYAVAGGRIYVLEVNPRASRTIPFVSKVTGVPLARLAAKVQMGMTLDELGITGEARVNYVGVKEAVFPFNRFDGVDATLGPEMLSTGEVMGVDTDFPMAFAKSQLAAGPDLPLKGTVLITVNRRDRAAALAVARKFRDMGFKLMATRGTGGFLRDNGVESEPASKLHEARPHILDHIKNRGIDLIVNTPGDRESKKDETRIRSQAVLRRIPLVTTMRGAEAVADAVGALRDREIRVRTIQELHGLDLPLEGGALLSVRDRDKRLITAAARRFLALGGFELFATAGTRAYLAEQGVESLPAPKVGEPAPTVLDMIRSGRIRVIVNTPLGSVPREDEVLIRDAALEAGVPMISAWMVDSAVGSIAARRRHEDG